MKFFLTIFLLSTFALPSMASKARIEGLGQANRVNVGGISWSEMMHSLYLEDDRNIFLNPAVINNANDTVIVEWGGSGATETATATRTEGGFYKKGSLNYGLYLGSEDPNLMATRGESVNTVLAPDEVFDIFIGKKASTLSWGASLTYSDTKSILIGGNKASQSLMLLKGGVVMNNNVEAYAHLYLTDEATGTTADEGDKYKGDTSLVVGGSYKHKDMKFFGHYGNVGADFTQVGGTNTDIKGSALIVGAARVQNLSGGKMFFYSVAYESYLLEGSTGTIAKDELTRLPIKIGFEIEAKDWLTFRGAISQNVLINEHKNTAGSTTTKVTDTNSTEASGGMTVKFGDLKFDGAFATNSGLFSLANLMYKTSMTFNF